MEIEHLREFSYLAETLSFNLTASHFFMGVSAVSKHISALEETLQVKLFDRNRQKVELTEEGELFYKDAILLLNQYDKMLENVATFRERGEFNLRIGYLRNASKPFLAHIVRYMEKYHEKINLTLTCMEYGELIHAHRAHRVDLIFTINLDPEAVVACDAAPVYTDRFYAIVGKEHPLASKGTGVTVNDLLQEKIILPSENEYPGLADRYLNILGNEYHPISSLTYNDIDTLFLSVSQGRCVGLSSGHNAGLFGSDVRFLPIEDVDTSYNVECLWLKSATPEIEHLGIELANVGARAMRKWEDGVAAQK